MFLQVLIIHEYLLCAENVNHYLCVLLWIMMDAFRGLKIRILLFGLSSLRPTCASMVLSLGCARESQHHV